MQTHIQRAMDKALKAEAKAKASTFPYNGWAGRHISAWQSSRPAIGGLIRSWLLYADTHRERYESGIGEDGFLGKEWAAIGFSLRDLLNGELGGLDGGLCDGIIVDALEREGWDADTQDRKEGFIIRGREDREGETLYWSNEDGWVDRGSATVFTDAERQAFALPLEAHTWEQAG